MVELPYTLKADETGTYVLTANASKPGFKTIESTLQFAVIAGTPQVEGTLTCNGNGECESGENSQNCPLDCPSGGADGYCDRMWDNKCDPDCAEGDDPDCELPICNNDGNCEVEVGEHHGNCPTDCPQSEKDDFCDALSDGKCDPDCTPGEDTDCSVTPVTYPLHILGVAVIIVLLAVVLGIVFLKKKQS